MSLYDDASLILYPSGYKEDKIYSLKPTDGSGDLTFTRASTATRVNAEGLIETSPVNLLTYSEQFENAAWTKNELTITANNATSPNGIQNADTALETTTNAYHDILNTSTSLTLNTNYTLSCFVKYAGREYIYLFISDGIAAAAVKFNVQTGVVLGTALGTVVSSKIENFGNGWYRCSIVYTASVSVTGTIAISTTNSPALSLATYAGDVTKGISVWGAQLNIGTTAKTYFPTTDRLDVPRIDYTGGGCGKLLLEPQRTNLALYSEQLDNAYWTKLGATITANAATSPDGTQNADKLVEDVGSVQPSFYRTNIANSNTTYTKSIYAKAGERIWLVMNIGNGIDSARAWFNLSTGVVGTVNAGLTAQIQDAGNGWYRCTITREIVAFASSVIEFQIATSDGVEGYTGNGTSGLFIYGCQFEAGSYVSSYVKTLASSVTRLADAAFKTGISSLIGQTEGVVFLDFVMIHESISSSEDVYALVLSNGTSNNLIYFNNYNLTFLIGVVNGGSTQFQNGSFSGSDGQRIKVALAYKANDFALYINGSQIATGSNGSVPTLSQIDLASYFTGAYRDSIKANQLCLFPTRLTNAELATLTTI